MEMKLYKKKLSLFIKYYLILLPILFILFIQESSYNNKFSVINTILALLSLIVYKFYYSINKDNTLYLYILIYFSIFLELISDKISLFFTINSTLRLPLFEFTLRAIVFIFILYENNHFKKLLKNKIFFCILYIIINIICIILDILISNRWDVSFMLYIATLLSFIIIFKLILKEIYAQNFINSLCLYSLMVLGMNLIWKLLSKYIYISAILKHDSIYYTLSYMTLIIGVLIEFKYSIIENIKLNNDVKVISNNMEQIKDMNNLKNDFFSNISHELKTPINVIYSSFQLLESYAKNDAQILYDNFKKHTPALKQNCWRLTKLTNNIVDLNKINCNCINANMHNYDIVFVTEHTVICVAEYLKTKKKHLNIIFDTSLEEAYILFDYKFLQRIILNLLSNSIKFCECDGNILVEINHDNEFIYITVKDDGCGIPKDKLDFLFNPFSKIDTSFTRKHEGIGLGLYLIKSIAINLGGDIYNNPFVDKGTEIILKLPNKRLEDEENIIIENQEILDNEILDTINIEFSDIYDLF